jgi:hypothetical protein
MDIYCRNCGEPWENETLHEVAEQLGTTYSKVAKDFSATGCKAFNGSDYETTHCKTASKSMRTMSLGLIADLLGDDMDGYSAMVEDMDYLGMLD